MSDHQASPVRSFDAAHMAKVNARMLIVDEAVHQKIAALKPSREAELRLLRQAFMARTASKRIFWLRRASDHITSAAAPLAACKKGCSHCCHISVVTSKAEAQVIAQETGRKLNPEAGFELGALSQDQVRNAQTDLADRYFGQACIFLKDGACSIYEQRPLACRHQLNMDNDDLLCQLVEGGHPTVPYLDLTAQKIASIAVLGASQPYDDIRAWFGGGI